MKLCSVEEIAINGDPAREKRLSDRVQLIESALFYLMSKHAQRPGIGYAAAIVDHLRLLLNTVGTDHNKRNLYQRMLPTWKALARDRNLFDDTLPAPHTTHTH